ncbi:MAG: hypothetical protein GY798_07745, partial [Hyphomicrobiales bacterium]|nr:hypothetical protein [Hyphomicrobiales bacterium]
DHREAIVLGGDRDPAWILDDRFERVSAERLHVEPSIDRDLDSVARPGEQVVLVEGSSVTDPMLAIADGDGSGLAEPITGHGGHTQLTERANEVVPSADTLRERVANKSRQEV